MVLTIFGFSAIKGQWKVSLNIKLLVASVHILTVFVNFSLILFCLFSGSCNFLALGSILKNAVLPEKVSCARGNFHSPSIQCQYLEIFVHEIYFFLFNLKPKPTATRTCQILIHETLLITFYWT